MSIRACPVLDIGGGWKGLEKAAISEYLFTTTPGPSFKRKRINYNDLP
jgi:hypothetical protein